MARDAEVSSMDPIGSMLLLATMLSIVGIILYILEKKQIITLPKSIFGAVDKQRKRSSVGSSEKEQHLPPTGTKEPSIWEIITNSGVAARDFYITYTGPIAFTYRFLDMDYLIRLLACTLFFAWASYINSLAAVCAGWRTPNIRIMDFTGDKMLPGRILPDLGHDFLEIMERFEWFRLIAHREPDVPLQIVGYVVTAFVFTHPKRMMMFRRIFAVFGYVNVLRAICVSLTSLPDSSARCGAQFGDPSGEYKLENMFPQVFHRALILTLYPSTVVTCGDMIFSGHTVMLMLCCATIHKYCQHSELETPLIRLLPSWTLCVFRWVIYTSTFLGLLTIVGTRLHYTLDVLIAVYITLNCWYSYHFYAKLVRTEKPTSRFSLLALFYWLEAEEVQSVDEEAYRNATTVSTPLTSQSAKNKKAM